MKHSASTILLAALLLVPACSLLDTAPEDYYASGNYWTTASQAEAYLSGIYGNVRKVAFNHTIRFGELGSGIYRTPLSVNGNNVADQPIITHNLTPDVPGVDSWGGYYTAIADCNLFLEKASGADYIPQKEKEYLLAQVYGLRALLYFDLYRIWGGVPLRTEPDLAAHGESEVKNLYLARSSASETMEQILSDVDTSLELFGSQDGFDPYSLGAKVFWNKAASQCLAAEILLWNTKVSVGDYAARTDGSLLDRAKTLLEEVASRTDLSLEDNFADIFSASNKAGKEVIFTIHYGIGEASNEYGAYLYPTTNGSIQASFSKEGSLFGDPLNLGNGYNQTYEYNPAVYLQFDGASSLAAQDSPTDSRALATFTNIYDDTGAMQGSICTKNIGEISSGIRVMDGDVILYRLAWVHLTLAEIANYRNDASAFEEHLNAVRKRAYGANWDESLKVAGASFKENELAILHEKDKEFIQEGQRW